MRRESASAVESAKLLRQALKAAFPATAFSVRLDRGTAYGWCRVSWTDGPTRARIEAIANRFEGQGFDGSTDSTYYIDNVLPDGRETGLRGINCERRISDVFWQRVATATATYWGLASVPTRGGSSNVRVENAGGQWFSDLVYRATNDRQRIVFGDGERNA